MSSVCLLALCASLLGSYLGCYQWEAFLFQHPLEAITVRECGGGWLLT